MEITSDTVWKGEYEISGTVTVASDALLTIEEGSKIYFRGEGTHLVVNGGLMVGSREGNPVIFAMAPEAPSGSMWGGIEVLRSIRESNLKSARISDAVTALSVGGSSVRVRDCQFESNRVAIDTSMDARIEITGTVFSINKVGIEARLRSVLKLRGNIFKEHEQFGVFLSTGAGGQLTDNQFWGGGGILIQQGKNIFLGNNTFHNTTVGIVANQVNHDVRISGNTFLGGKTGLQCLNYSTPWVACCRFEGLEMAALIQKFSNPLLTNNLFEGNTVGVRADQKSNFPVRYNIFRKNEQALFIDLSSYPAINWNNFTDNTRDVVLGKYMSTDWEEKIGSRTITLDEAQRIGSRNLRAFRESRKFKGQVDASHNWWGKSIINEMENAGADGNISGIEDYFDTPGVSYPGFGEGVFKLDRVKYSPWELSEIEEAGPKLGGCGDLEDADEGDPEK